MEYGNLFKRAWDLIWKFKFLILLGLLVTLGSAGGSSNAGMTASSTESTTYLFKQDLTLPQIGRELDLPPRLYTLGAVGFGVVALLIGLALWILSTIARGALVAGASDVDAGNPSGFGAAFRAGWVKGWTLLGIALLPALPGLLLVIVGAGAGAAAYLGHVGLNVGPELGLPRVTLIAGLACLLVPLALVLSLLHTFANRACVLEGLGVFAAYRRGAEVLLSNLGPALLLFVLQVVVSVGLFIVFLLPTLVLALCCVIWPLLLLAQGALAAFFSTLWTLAWKAWTGGKGVQVKLE